MPNASTSSKVLLVDDDSVSRLLVRKALTSVSANLVEAFDGQSAIKAYGDGGFALAIVDIHLPGMNGFDLVWELRTAKSDVPVIFLTSHIEDQTFLAQGYALGAADFLEKSVPLELLRAKVSVFIDIDQRQKQLLERERAQNKVEQEQSKQRAKLEELEQSLADFRSLGSGGSTTPVTQSITGAGSIQERAAPEFKEMIQAYGDLLDEYLEQLVVSAEKPIGSMSRLIRRIGNFGGGPRDLLDVHLAALEQAIEGQNPRRTEAYSVEGRLLALEMMGLLVDYYRIGQVQRAHPMEI